MSDFKVKLFVDGIEMSFQNDVKIVVEGVLGDDNDAELHLNHTHEGVIRDVLMTNGESDEVVSTSWREYHELVEPIECGKCGEEIKTLLGGREDSGIICTECEEWFCDNCYDCSRGDGCHCHE